MKTAFIFPGQGAQYVGMAQDFVQNDPSLARILEQFDLGHNTQLAKTMAEGPDELLKQTHLTQPAILFHSICALRAFQARYKLQPSYVAGHSLGEFTALVASGILNLEQALHLVHKRGEFMIKAVGDTPFAMAAVIGLDSQVVQQICVSASGSGLVQAVNFNTPIQTVISGTESGVAKASELAKVQGAKRVLPLVVGGPFHTPLIDKASGWLIDEMNQIQFKDGSIPVVSNLDAQASTGGDTARNKLGKQIISAVQWVDCIRFMVKQGVTHFIEFGPQKVLCGMIKNIDKEASCFNIDRIEDLAALEEIMK